MALGLLPELSSVDFTGSTVPAEERLAFREGHPELAVSWDVRIMDQSYSCETQLLDFSGVPFTQEGLDELEEAMAYLPALEQVEMHETGLTNEALDALNTKYENVNVVWTVRFGYNNYYTLRTDAEYFRADYALRAMFVPAGSHSIRFVFDPDSVKKGDRMAICFIILLYLSVAAIAVTAVVRRIISDSGSACKA